MLEFNFCCATFAVGANKRNVDGENKKKNIMEDVLREEGKAQEGEKSICPKIDL